MIKKRLWQRSTELVKAAGRVAAQELSYRAKEALSKNLESSVLGTRIDQAKILVESLAQLKGAAMKAGQLLSLEAANYLPPEVLQILSQLQGDAQPVPFEQIEEVLRAELGENLYREFESLNPVPVAAASIAQVHRSRYQGKEVAIKVQYPGVGEAIHSDLTLLKKVAASLLTISGRKIPLDELFVELENVLHQETNFLNEAENLVRVRELLRNSQSFAVPKVVSDLCRRRVLVMSWEEGERLGQWIQRPLSQEQIALIADRFLDLFCTEFFDWGIVQTDPNFANFLVREDPLQLVLLDFGATLTYDFEFRQSYREILKAAFAADDDKLLRLSEELELIDPRENKETQQAFLLMMMNSIKPFRPEEQPFNFADSEYESVLRQATLQFMRLVRYTPPPRRILFLHRKLGGIFNLLRRIRVQRDLTPYWERIRGPA